MKKINTLPLNGFVELLPEDQMLFDSLRSIIENSYKSFGFLHLDTPIIERSEVLLVKAGGETEKQIYRFNKGDADMCLRFDLTVPLARYIAEHFGDITFPFKRYQIGKVFRGERPQRGRYREFFQSDIDIIGDGHLPIQYDAEVVLMVYSIFKNIGFEHFTIRINNRKILNGFFESIGKKEDSQSIMRIIDKIDKIGIPSICEELQKIGITEDCIEKIKMFISVSGSTQERIEAFKNFGIKDQLYMEGIKELEMVIATIASMGVPSDRYIFDPSIARGLDYYTGTVYETTLDKYPSVGSVCSGGRYEDLASSYTKRKFPGVGVSIGLTRLFFQLKEIGFFEGTKLKGLDVVIIPFLDFMKEAFHLAKTLRKSGARVNVYMEDERMHKAFRYADRIRASYVIVIGEEEIKTGLYTIKTLETKKEEKKTIAEILDKLSR